MSLLRHLSRHRGTSPEDVRMLRAAMFERVQELLGYEMVLPAATTRGLRRAAFALYLDAHEGADIGSVREFEHATNDR
jgi:hypothetical protein